MSDIWTMCELRTQRIAREAAEIECLFILLDSLKGFEQRPVARAKQTAKRLREVADQLDRMAESAPKPIMENA